MNRLAVFLFAIVPAALFAGFAQNLDLSSLSDIPDECKKLSGNVTEYGWTEENVWTPAPVRADETTGLLKPTGENAGYSRPASLDAFIQFGTYDDTASIESFMDRGEFWTTDKHGERVQSYTSSDISAVYMQMENQNYDSFDSICNEIYGNVEKYFEQETAANGGQPTERAIKALNAVEKLFMSGRDARSKSAANAITMFATRVNAATTDDQKRRAMSELRAAQNMASKVNYLNVRLTTLSENVTKFKISYMNDVNRIGAYLGSTTAMEYFSAEAKEIISAEGTKKWMKFNTPNPLFRDAADEADYTTVGKLGTFNGYPFDNIFRLMGSTYFVTYMDSNWLERFANTYDQGEFDKYNIRGFLEEVESDGDTVTTNWYANKITAPKNWADGTSIVVTNGKFSVASEVQTTNLWVVVGSSYDPASGAFVMTQQEIRAVYIPSSESRTVTVFTARPAD